MRDTARDRMIAEAPLAVVAATAALCWIFGDDWLQAGTPAWTLFVTAWLFGVILLAALATVRHAEVLATRLGEPFGTLILTLSVTTIEVLMVSAVMLTGADQPELARDTMYSVVMIVLNGLVGLSLLLGGLRHHEQEYNLQGANAFLALILPLAVLTLILPRYTRATPGPILSSTQELFLMAVALGLYAVFLAVQTVRHRSYFTASAAGSEESEHASEHGASTLPTAAHGLLLLAYLVPVVLLSEELGIPLERSVEALEAPQALTGMLVALLILAPEGVAALRASLANQLQRAVNVALGSAAATIGLTVPAVLAVSLWTGKPVVLGLDDDETVMLALTLLVSVVTFSSGRTNVLQGAVHVVLFLAYVLLVFD
ncbi:MAG: calcium:proton antiporter [Deltaproteobacteria bacterium]|nr:calcium:proton antiporter [Deltaproteobacteria bacterium]